MSHVLFQIIFYLTITVSLCYAEEKFSGTELPSSLNNHSQNQEHINLEPFPSAIVNGCVNVITGDYQEAATDLSIPGTASFDLERFYSSGNCQLGTLQYGWQLNHSGKLISQSGKHTHNVVQGTERSGVRFRSHHSSHAVVPASFLKKGVTNSSRGLFVENNDLRNDRLNDFRDSKLLTTGSGTCYEFSRDHHAKENNKNKKISVYSLKSIVEPSGINYSYQSNPQYRCLEKFQIFNKKQKHVSGLHLFGIQISEEAIEPAIKTLHYLSDTGNRGVVYHFKTFGSIHGLEHGLLAKRVILTKVESSDALTVEYTYEEADGHRNKLRIVEKKLPNSRLLGISYHKQGHFLKDKVSSLRAPVGTTNALLTTYQFEYEDVDGHCAAYVTNPRGYQTEYHWLKNEERIHCIKFLDENKNIVLQEQICWGGKAGHPSLLSSHIWGDSQDHLLAGNTYGYDAKGNVISDTLYGNLTGRIPTPSAKENYPQPIDCEKYSKKFHYDSLNRLSIEDDGRLFHTYVYEKNTDLITAKFTIYDGRIQIREFYEYDDSAAIKLEIIDDGSSEDRENLADVTERKIKTYDNHLTGLPATVIEKALDLKSGQERSLSQIVQIYNKENRVSYRRRHGSDNQKFYVQEWRYDGHGYVSYERNHLNPPIHRFYDGNDNLDNEVFPENKAIHHISHDFMDRICGESWEDPISHEKFTKTYLLDTMGNCTKSTDIYGHDTYYKYDSQNHLIETIYPEVQDENGNWFQPTYKQTCDALGRIISITDPKGYTTKTSYNSRNRPVCIDYPDGSCERFYYTLQGELEESISKDGSRIKYSYDPQGREIQKDWFDSQGFLIKSTIKTYNAFHLISESESNGNSTYYTYDWAGRLAKKESENRTTTYEYDDFGRIHVERTFLEDGGWIGIVKNYDCRDRVTHESKMDSFGNEFEKKEYQYDSEDKCIAFTIFNQSGEATTYTKYDAFGRITKVIDPLNCETYTHYGKAWIDSHVYSTEETINPRGFKTIQYRDALNRIVQTQRLDLIGTPIEETHIFYDKNGNRARCDQFTDDGKITTLFAYDSQNRLIKTVEAYNTPDQKIIDRSYDLSGRLISFIKPDGIILNYTYDSFNNLITLTSSDQTLSYKYTYDSENNLIEAYDITHDSLLKRKYNKQNELIEEIFPSGYQIAYAYDQAGRLINTRIDSQTEIITSYEGLVLKSIQRVGTLNYEQLYQEYDAQLHPTLIHLPNDSGSLTYQYDLKQRPVLINHPLFQENLFFENNLVTRRGCCDSLGKELSEFSYNAKDELTSESGSKLHHYSYDRIGNLTQYDGNERHFNQRNALTNDTDCSYTYDLNGNRTSNGNTTYRYDALDRLIEVKTSGDTYHYSYDATGRRLARTHGQQTDQFIYQKDKEIGLIASNQIKELRILDPDDRAIAIELNQQLYIPIQDAFGNVRILLDSANCVANYRYTAFGQEELSGIISPWRFGGERTDAETGFISFGKRFYDPHTFCWITPDPLDDIDGLNLYAYVHNNPLLYVDPDGTFSLINWIKDNPRIVQMTATAIAIGTVVGWGAFGLAEGLLSGCSDGIMSTAIDLAIDGASIYQQGGVAAACAQADTATMIYHGCRTLGRVAGAIYSCTPHGKATQAALSTATTTMHLAKGARNAAKMSKSVTTNVSKTQKARQLGRAGEEAVNKANGFTKNTVKIPSALDREKMRIPDIYDKNKGIIGETKNVKYLSFSRQVRDTFAISKRDSLKCTLFIRPDTKLSEPLKEAIKFYKVFQDKIPSGAI